MAAEPYNTVSPAEVHADSFSESDQFNNDSFDASLALVFPDTMYPVKETSLVLGRDMRLQDFLEKHTDIRVTKQHPNCNPPDRQEYEQAISNISIPSEDDEYDDEDFSLTEPRYASLEGGIATFDINLHRQSHDDETFLPIHPPGDEDTGRFPHLGAISKQHLRIYRDDRSDRWMMEVLGRNGVFVNYEHYEAGQHILLDHKMKVSVGQLNFKTIMEDVADSELESEDEYSSTEDSEDISRDESETTPEAEVPLRNGRKIQPSTSGDESDDEDRARSNSVTQARKGKPTTKLKLKVTAKPPKPMKEDKHDKAAKDKAQKKPKETSEEAQKKILSLLQPGEEPGRRKGPGRPPANGLMSKREMKERQKAKQDAARREKDGSLGDPVSPGPEQGAETEGKLGFDEKMRNKKRKRSDTTGDPKAESADRKRRQTPEKSPEPTEDQFTAEQLAQPGATYVVIIYRILSEVAPQQLNLQQLYREMKRRHPYYRFRPKPGWESSVRHTVSAENFIKGEKDGKGYKYTYNPDKPPAPQKQKQVTAPSQPPNYSQAYGATAPAGQFQPGAVPNGSYSTPYPNSYQQNSYNQLPVHNHPRPLANGASQPSQAIPLQPSTQQNPASRNLQNSPYPIHPQRAPTALSNQPSRHPNTQPQSYAAPTSLNQTSNGQISNSRSQIPHNQATTTAATHPSAATSTHSQPQLNSTSQQQSMKPNTSSAQNDSQNFNGGSLQVSGSNHTPAQMTSSQPTQASHTATSGPAPSPQPNTTNLQSQPISRSGSQQGVAPTPANRPKTPFQPTPSEDLAQGRIPKVIQDFVDHMKHMASNMPENQQELELAAINHAVNWVKANPKREFKQEPGMSSYTVSLIVSFINMIKTKDAEILRSRATVTQQRPFA